MDDRIVEITDGHLQKSGSIETERWADWMEEWKN